MSADPKRLADIKRLRKCLRLAQSATVPGEAAAALHQAQRLMRTLGLTEDDPALADIRELSTGASGGASLAQWELALVDCVRNAFGVQVMFVAGSRGAAHCVFRDGRTWVVCARKRGKLLFIGPESRASVALYAYESLLRQLRRARQAQGRETGQRGRALNLFALGWVLGVRRKVEALAAPFPVDAATQAYADALSTRASAPGRDRQIRSDREARALHAGVRASDSAVLNPGVGGQGGAHPLAAPAKALAERRL